MSIVFQKAGLSDLTFERGRSIPYSPEDLEISQERYLTENMNPKVVDYGATLNTIKLMFEYLSKDNFDGSVNGLKTWFASTQVNYSANNFTMIDETGASKTVRLWQDKMSWGVNVAGRYSIELNLIEE